MAKTGASGFAIGVERLLMALYSEKKSHAQEKRLDLYAAVAGSDVYAEAFKTVIALREKGLFCDIDLQDKSLKAQMRQANKKRARFTAIFGEDELKRGEVVLRDMKTSEQKNVRLTELAEEVASGIN